MVNIQWTTKDFDVFNTEGFAERMDALKTIVRPKFEALGEYFAGYFSTNTGEEFFPHVAKHARRTVNPPKDSWVAFAPYKRGYKSLPHFQIGLWHSHLFIILAIIYETPQKADFAHRLLNAIEVFDDLPDDSIVSGVHMNPDAISLKEARDEQLEKLLVRLRDVKKGEFLVGVHIPREKCVQLTPEEFIRKAENTFEALMPVYDVITGRNEVQ